MRLAAFKASGFKSFAEPISFKVGGELTGIVGPNGCGKSNIVDAVRWALGESRASSLRGGTLSDVLFNGSEKRPPADWCEVELRFANEGGSSGGMWAAYPEITVRRELGRDGRQSYTINGSAVRRRDVVDLFRGTGVAPRAYGVVEQGMVSDIAEASPEELRAFMEEAAGVSHYKERRRDSERRLAASRDNIAQLGLILDGLYKQGDSLKRQARTARRHNELREEINRLEALLILAQRRGSEAELAECRRHLQQHDKKIADLQARLAALKDSGAKQRQRRDERQAAAEESARQLGEAQKKVAVAERDVENTTLGRDAVQARQQEAQQDLAALEQQRGALQGEEKQLQAAHRAAQEKTAQSSGAAEAEASELARLQGAQAQAQAAAKEVREQLAQAQRQLETEDMRRQMRQEKISDIEQRLAALMLAPPPPVSGDVGEEEAQQQQAESALQAARQRHSGQAAAAASADEAVRQAEKRDAELQAQISTLTAMLQEEGKAADGQRLATVLQVDAGKWSAALDAALGAYAAAAVVEDVESFIGARGTPAPGAALLEMTPEETAAEASNPTGLPRLIDQLKVADAHRPVLDYWLAEVYAAEDDAAAMAARKKLRRQQCIVTPRGIVYGAHSLLASGETRGGYDWERRLGELRQQREALALADKTSRHREAETAAAAASAQVEQLAQQLADAQQRLADRRIALSRELEQQRAAQQRYEESLQQQQTLGAQQRQLQAENQAQEKNLAALQAAHRERQAASDAKEGVLAESTAVLDSYRETMHQAMLARQDQQRQAEELRRRLQEMEERKRHNAEQQQLIARRVQEFSREIKRFDESALQKQLAAQRQQLESLQAAADKCRAALRAVEEEIAQIEEQREQARGELEERRQQAEAQRLSERELALQMERLSDSLDELALPAEALAALESEPAAPQQQHQEAIEARRAKISRLGAINFMADSELRGCEQKISEAEGQKADIEAAIDELKSAIAAIDSETKTRLQSAFEHVNREFGALFRRIFDGGEARLEMVGDAILDSGFELKVRPPGKRLFPVRMLSGGEKAASAVAFICAILRMNPPPFCILDEVDAPLDDSRSLHFADMLQDIAKTVQCLIVTHNKSTISLMPRLIGITQEEAGISKVVSVTLGDALRAAGR